MNEYLQTIHLWIID